VLLIEKENETVRYHAAQSIIVFSSVTILNIILPMILFVFAIPLMGLINLVAIILQFRIYSTILYGKPIKVGFPFILC